MKLASLAYEIVRDAIEFPSGFNEIGFVRGDFDEDRNFSSQISFVFNYINLAFSRLVTSKKTLLKTVQKISDETGYIEFTDVVITAIVTDMSRNYERVHFMPFSNGVAVESDYVSKVLYIEYRPNVPRFELSTIRNQETDENNRVYYEEIIVNLEDFGITDEMCSYVKEYAKGGLMEYLSPELSARHVQMAENYFGLLKTQHTRFPQRKIEDRFDNGGVF